MPASILYLRLDDNYDLVWDPAAQLTDIDAVAQAIKTRLLLLEGEWWEDLNEGTPLFQEILNVRKTVNNQQLAQVALTSRISGTPYVSAVQDVSVQFNNRNRAMSFEATADTAFGTVIVNVPGAETTLGG